MATEVLTPTQQGIVICALAGLLLAVSLLGLWLCARLRRAYARLYIRQREETVLVLGNPDYRQPPRVPSPAPPPAVETSRERTAEL